MNTIIAAFTGLLWGILGVYLTKDAFGSFSIYAAPSGVLIGVLIYHISRWSYSKPIWALIPVSVITTFIAVALFGMALGFADLSRGIPRIEYAVILQAIFGCIWGLIFIPPFWILFPLAFGNHLLLRSLERSDTEQGAAANP